MHGDLIEALGHQLRDRTTNVVWAQWAALGSRASSRRQASAVIDPEALVLASLGLVPHEGQLADLLRWWAEVGSGLLSVQRMRNLGAAYPGSVRAGLGEFAGHAWGAGGDHRWKALAEGVPLSDAASVAARAPVLAGPGCTLLRLRLGLGVGIKADMLCALLGRSGWWSIRELAEATLYTPRAVRRAGAELARGGWIEASPDSPAEHRTDAAPWLPLLELEAPAPWRQWHPLFVLVTAVDAWIRAEGWRGQQLAEVEGSARGLVDAHRSAFKWSGVPVPEPVSRPDAEYIRAFGHAVESVVDRMEAMV